MRQLLPDPLDVDPAAAHAAAHRPAPVDRPWLAINMVASADGATAIDGVSGGLGGPADKDVFRAIRAVADVILVAAGTVRAEGYGPPRTSPERQAERVVRSQQPHPRIAIVTASVDLDPSSPVFTEAAEPPLVLTVDDAPADRVAALADVAEVHHLGAGHVDLHAAVGLLGGLGARCVVVEGGPALNGQLLAAGLVDELNLTIAPLLVGGGSDRICRTPVEAPTPLALAHLWEADELLFARYVATTR